MSDTGFLFIPEHIMEREDLSLQEKCVYGRIVGLTKKEGYCYITNEVLGSKLGFEAKTVSKYISKLVEKGFLYLEVSKNKKGEGTPQDWGTRRKIYTFLPTQGYPYPQTEVPPYPQTEAYSNTVNRGQSPKIGDETLTEPLKANQAPVPVETSDMPQDYRDRLAQKALNRARKEAKKRYGGNIPPWVNLDREVQRASVTIARGYEAKMSPVKYPTPESVTEDILIQVAEDNKITLEDCKNTFEVVKNKIEGGTLRYRDYLAALKNEIIFSLQYHRIRKIETFREKTMREFGIDIAEENEEPDQLTTYENKEQQA